jgi:hypothetical protein
MAHLTSFYSHARAVHQAASALGMRATARLSDFALELAGPGEDEVQVWQPKFVASIHGRLCYTSHLGEGTTGFAGWMPYELRQWPIALDKIAFKRYAIAHDIPTPAACFDPALIQGPFLIKQATSSFGEGIRGPYRKFDPSDPEQRLQTGEYYENFILGLIAKAWCWGDECFAIHLHKPSVVTGDGRSSLRQLVCQLPNSRDGQNDWQRLEALGRYCGMGSPEEIVPEGKEVLIEFRYGSRYERDFVANPNVLEQSHENKLASQFVRAGPTFGRASSNHASGLPCLYTLDAMVDREGTVSFLEMNCNPVMHPDVYAGVLLSSMTGRVSGIGREIAG